ncbi:MAG: type II secretion system F family protein [Armatimonadetes bacterium]|nr:type II secretion system F family protein [Armatimonadota bacterium]MDW8029029.1 type II secretion system F family protein [Armatimonadota bacterium]
MALNEELMRWAGALAEALETSKGKRSFVECLELAEQVVNDLALRHTLKIVRNIVAQGCSLSRAMERFPEVFNPVIITVVRYGEIYGELDLTLRRFAERPEDLEPKCALKTSVQP